MNATAQHRYDTASGVELAIFVMLTHDGDSSACVVELRRLAGFVNETLRLA